MCINCLIEMGGVGVYGGLVNCRYSETSDKGHSKNNKHPYKGQVESTHLIDNEDNLSMKDKRAGPKGVPY